LQKINQSTDPMYWFERNEEGNSPVLRELSERAKPTYLAGAGAGPEGAAAELPDVAAGAGPGGVPAVCG
jgi:hypothetical protein